MIMIRFVMMTAALCAMTSSVLAHGFSLSVSNNALSATSNDYPGNGNPHLFFTELNLTSGQLRSSHGGAGTSLFGNNKSLSFDVYSPLFYSNGSGDPAEPAADGISMIIDSQNFIGSSITVDGTTNFVSGYQITGNSSHEFRWTLTSDSTTLPQGIYGLAYKVSGGPLAGGSYDPSPLLVVTFSTPGFDLGFDPLAPDSPLSLANAAIFAAATNPVPEPSTCVLFGLGALGVAMGAWRKRHRVKLAA